MHDYKEYNCRRRNLDMDNKEQQIMKHYKMLIESNMFDEYDILGFLIFITTFFDSIFSIILPPYQLMYTFYTVLNDF